MVTTAPTTWLRRPSAYRPLDLPEVLSYLGTVSSVRQRLGGEPSEWQALECGDGNLNLVFVVRGTADTVVVKQALPYVRMVGESWPLSVQRNFFEHCALQEQRHWAPEFVPAVQHTDDGMALIVMDYLDEHTVLRAGFLQARTYPHVGEHLGHFLARTLFNTSELRLSGSAKKEKMTVFLANTAMCQITEDVVFDEPYFAAPLNRHTSPQLDAVAADLARDSALKVAVQAMKWRFMNQPESLLHGDLHTGSVMVTEDDTSVIDPEFACYGPMGFDIGTLLANFLMAYLSQPGHEARSGDRDPYRRYLAVQLVSIWTAFTFEFSRLWRTRGPEDVASLCNQRLNHDSPMFSENALTWRLQQIWDDALGFAGCEVIRRVVGLAHIADFEAIVDPDRRAACEQRAIRLARGLLLDRPRCRGISELAGLVEACP